MWNVPKFVGHNEKYSIRKVYYTISKALERYHASYLKAHLKPLEQKEASTHNRNRQQEIVKLKAKVNKVKIWEQHTESMKERFGSFGKPARQIFFNLSFTKLDKWHREYIQMKKIWNKKGGVTTETKKIQRTISSYSKNLYSKK